MPKKKIKWINPGSLELTVKRFSEKNFTWTFYRNGSTALWSEGYPDPASAIESAFEAVKAEWEGDVTITAAPLPDASYEEYGYVRIEPLLKRRNENG